MDRYTADNLHNWNDRVPIHASSDLYSTEKFLGDPDRLSTTVAVDRPYLGDVAGKTLLHTQCHMGLDTLSWAKLGATVTGIDFSAPAIEAARRTAEKISSEARFVVSELLASPEVVDETFDIVYTGVGAINWIPSIAEWADVMATFTKRSGTFYMREAHPIVWALDWEREDELISITEHYFERDTPSTWHEPTTYAGGGTLDHDTIHSWNHGLGEILTALMSSGFRIDLFEEHKFLDWKALPHMTETNGLWVLPEHQRDLVPLMYSLRATKV